MSVEYRNRLLDVVRNKLGDGANDLLTDEEISAFIECRALDGNRQTETVTAWSGKFRSSFPKAVHELLIDEPLSVDHVYRADEGSKFIEYISGGTPPVDQERIKISYVRVNFNMIVADCFEEAASAHAKMTSVQSVGGMTVDATKLSDAFRKEAQYWACKGQW